MILSESKHGASVVRIHDEYCEPMVESCLQYASAIISDSYKRRIRTKPDSVPHPNAPKP
jgi:hypothetical protein